MIRISSTGTQTGQAISTFSTGKIPYVVRLNPDDDKQNILLAGMSDKKIVQWDMNTGQVAQEYDQHLGAVNTITFVDNNRRFVSSSDDKSLRGLVASLLYVARCGYHVMNLPLAHRLPHIYSSAPQKPYQPPSSPCFPCGTCSCRYYPALENNLLQYSIPVASKNCPFG
ncbi:hypothetical protein SO802_030585 [Lithocarpus litseifolius]|uniref:Uncharacterized protein n=1 Tax=Lithocarpus litseifolius TaxID=425828 RepID=A0AAW2BKZ5_9ROSI